MSISYDLDKGTATKSFDIEFPEKYQGFSIQNNEFRGIIQRVLKKNPELNNFSWLLSNSSNQDFTVIMICKGSKDEEKLKTKYDECYFDKFQELIESNFLAEITIVVSKLMVRHEATEMGIYSKYHQSALKVKTQTVEMNEKQKLISEKTNAINKLKREIEELNKDLYLLSKPIAINEINSNPHFTEDEKKEILQIAGLA